MINNSKELYAALQHTGDEVAVTKSLYLHFWEVLPAIQTGSNFFIFQENDGERLCFSKYGDKYGCCLMSDILLTEDCNIHAHIARTNPSDKFKLEFVFDNEACDTPDEFHEFIGEEFVSVSAIANAMNLSFRV
jgi:hypothetical protein